MSRLGFCDCVSEWLCSSIFRGPQNGGLDPSWLDLAFLGSPDFPSRAPQIPNFKGVVWTSGQKIGAPKKRQIQHDGPNPHSWPSDISLRVLAVTRKLGGKNQSSKDRPGLPKVPQHSAEPVGFCRKVLQNVSHSKKLVDKRLCRTAKGLHNFDSLCNAPALARFYNDELS